MAFEDINVLTDPEGREQLVRLSGQMSIPVTVIDGEVVVGFDRARLEELLARA